MANKKASAFNKLFHYAGSAESGQGTSSANAGLMKHDFPAIPQNNMRKKTAFTFAELMVSLVIIAVITALLYPTISEISPNNNKQLFRSAYKTIELTVQDIISSGEDISSQAKLCNAFKSRLNTVSWKAGGVTYKGCETTGTVTNELHTSNGMRWWFQDYTAGATPSAPGRHTIYVDVNASNNAANNSYRSQVCGDSCDHDVGESTNPDTGNPIAGSGTENPKKDPANLTTHWPHGCFRNNNSTIRDTFKIIIMDNGVVDPKYDDQGSSHLRDESN